MKCSHCNRDTSHIKYKKFTENSTIQGVCETCFTWKGLGKPPVGKNLIGRKQGD